MPVFQRSADLVCLQFIRLMTRMWIVPAELWGGYINWKMEVAPFH